MLVGKPFSACVEYFPMAVPIGVVDASTGQVILLPDSNYQIVEGTGIIVIAEDNESYTCLRNPYTVSPYTCLKNPYTVRPKKIVGLSPAHHLHNRHHNRQ